MAETKKKTVKPAPEATEEKKPAAKKPAAKKAPAKKEVEAAPAKPAVTEARAVAKNVRVTPRKVRLVLDVVRGRNVEEALGILSRHNLNKAASEPVAKLIKSAAANATNNFGLKMEKLYIAEIMASDGIKMKRYEPRAKGSSSPIIKRCSNIRVTVKERN